MSIDISTSLITSGDSIENDTLELIITSSESLSSLSLDDIEISGSASLTSLSKSSTGEIAFSEFIVDVWDYDLSKNEYRKLSKNSSVVLSGDGNRLMTTYDTYVGVWKVLEYDTINSSWNQIGSNFYSEYQNRFNIGYGAKAHTSMTMSYDGSVIAFSDGEIVKVYTYENDDWTLIGDISGFTYNNGNIDRFKSFFWQNKRQNTNGPHSHKFGALSLSNDGKRLAMGMHHNEREEGFAGTIILEYDSGTTWNPIGTLIGKYAPGRDGAQLSGDGNTIIVASTMVPSGVRYGMGTGTEPLIQVGLVRVFKYGTVTEEEYNSGNTSNSLNVDGLNLSIIYPANQYTTADASPVPWSSTTYYWKQVGNDFMGDHKFSQIGRGNSINYDGTIIAFARPLKYQPNDFEETGYANTVESYQYNEQTDSWDLLGTPQQLHPKLSPQIYIYRHRRKIPVRPSQDNYATRMKLSADGYSLLTWGSNGSRHIFSTLHKYDTDSQSWIEKEILDVGRSKMVGCGMSMSNDGNTIAWNKGGNDIRIFRVSTKQVIVTITNSVSESGNSYNSIKIPENTINGNNESNEFIWYFQYVPPLVGMKKSSATGVYKASSRGVIKSN